MGNAAKEMNNNKETERAELHKTIWRIANDLRGSEMVGTSRTMSLACCSTASSQRIWSVTSMNRSVKQAGRTSVTPH